MPREVKVIIGLSTRERLDPVDRDTLASLVTQNAKATGWLSDIPEGRSVHFRGPGKTSLSILSHGSFVYGRVVRVGSIDLRKLHEEALDWFGRLLPHLTVDTTGSVVCFSVENRGLTLPRWLIERKLQSALKQIEGDYGRQVRPVSSVGDTCWLAVLRKKSSETENPPFAQTAS